jgi:glycosyltransferase involved in cell wall biosynthesis
VLEGLRRLDPDFRLLVIAGHKFDTHEWLNRLPEGSLFVDLHGAGVAGLTMDDVGLVAFRLVQHIPGIRRIHMKNCEFVDSFVRRYARFLGDLDTTFYHFCDPRVVVDGAVFTNGQCFDLVAETGKHLTRVISDHAGNLAELDRLVGREHLPPLETLYAVCDLPEAVADPARKPRRRLLWAARLDEQKRPHLLRAIAGRLAAAGLDVTIDAYGGTTYGRVGAEAFEGAPNLVYRGDYDGFASIAAGDYDAFVYTAAFDGLPNVVLEAMAAGLPVIAPDVGGIGEAVTSGTGFLLAGNDDDEDALADRFLDAIRALYENWPEAVQRGRNGRRLIAERHSAETYMAKVAAIFGLGNEAGPRAG